MTLPTMIDPLAVGLAAKLAADAIDASHYGSCADERRAWLLERYVGLLMDAGAFARDGKLFLPNA